MSVKYSSLIKVEIQIRWKKRFKDFLYKSTQINGGWCFADNNFKNL